MLRRVVRSFFLICLLIAPSAAFAQEPAATARIKSAAAPNTLPPSAYNAHPKLAIILVIDQFREDYLERYRADFKGHGFRLFLDQGAYFPDCYYDYANTKTAPGHSTIGTGAYSDGHGIANNDWWDLSRNTTRPITSVEDERYSLVGVPPTSKATPGASPRNLRASTVGDELRLATDGQAKVFGISLKDRASILPSGATANAAYWIDPPSGDFITSTYYMGQLPAWAAAFNASGRAAQAAKEAAVFANKSPLSKALTAVTTSTTSSAALPPPTLTNSTSPERSSPARNSDQHPVTDMLTLSLSANDILGHAVGPDAAAQHAMVDSLDTDLDSFFNWLDTHIDGGLGNVWIALTADHGSRPFLAKRPNSASTPPASDLKSSCSQPQRRDEREVLSRPKVNYLFDSQELPILSLNQPSFEQAGIKEHEPKQAVADRAAAAVDALAATPEPSTAVRKRRMPPTPVLVHAYTR